MIELINKLYNQNHRLKFYHSKMAFFGEKYLIFAKNIIEKIIPKIISYVVHLDLKFAKIEFHVQSDIYSQ